MSTVLWWCAHKESAVERQAWQRTSCHSCKFPQDKTRNNPVWNRQWKQILVTLLCSYDVRGVVPWSSGGLHGQGARNQWFHHSLGDIHSFVIFCDGGVSRWTPVTQKIGQCHVTFWGRPHGITLPEFATVQHWSNALDFNSGGTFNHWLLLFAILHIDGDGRLAMNPALQKVGVNMIHYFLSRYILRKISIASYLKMIFQSIQGCK